MALGNSKTTFPLKKIGITFDLQSQGTVALLGLTFRKLTLRKIHKLHLISWSEISVFYAV